MSSCELCGRIMKGRGRYVQIEGAEMLVCPQCAARFSKSEPQRASKSYHQHPHQASWIPGTSRDASPRHSRSPLRPPPGPSRPPQRKAATLDDMILIEDYAAVIRMARQKARISQEELAQRVGERISTLQAIEAGRLKPTGKTIRGLERELKISLLEPIDPIPIKVSQEYRSSSATLGDRVVIKRKKSQKHPSDR